MLWTVSHHSQSWAEHCIIGASLSEPHSSRLTGAFTLEKYTVYQYVRLLPLLNNDHMSIFYFTPALTNCLTGAFSLGTCTLKVYSNVLILPLLNSDCSSIFHFTAVDDNSQFNFVGTMDRADTHKCEITRNTLHKWVSEKRHMLCMWPAGAPLLT